MTRDEAWKILTEFTDDPSLLRHGLAVEAAMRHYADLSGEDQGLWATVGLLHDFDYQRWPGEPYHTRAGADVLRQRGVDERIVGAILSHAKWNRAEYPLDTPLRRTLSAVDELCGFLVACALVRPQGFEGMAAKSVRKKLKQPAFAAAVSRQDIEEGAQLLRIDLNEHIDHCIRALAGIAESLGLTAGG